MEVIRGEIAGREKGRKKKIFVARGYDRSQELRQRLLTRMADLRLRHLKSKLVRTRTTIFYSTIFFRKINFRCILVRKKIILHPSIYTSTSRKTVWL